MLNQAAEKKITSAVPETTTPASSTTTILAEESIPEKTVRLSKNGWTRLVGFYRQSSRHLQAKIKAVELDQKKRAFGLELMNRLEAADASDTEIQEMITHKQAEFSKDREKINFLKAEALDVKEKTRQKIRQNQKRTVRDLPNASPAEPVKDCDSADQKTETVPASTPLEFVVVN